MRELDEKNKEKKQKQNQPLVSEPLLEKQPLVSEPLVEKQPLVSEPLVSEPLVENKEEEDDIPLSKKKSIKLKIIPKKEQTQVDAQTKVDAQTHTKVDEQGSDNIPLSKKKTIKLRIVPNKEESLKHKSSPKSNEPIAEVLSELSPIRLSSEIVPSTVKKTTIKKHQSSSEKDKNKSPPTKKNKLRIVSKSIEDETTEKINKKLMSYNKPVPNIRASGYYLNNRQKFISFINNLFEPYKKEIEENEKEIDENSCDRDASSDFSPMAHQKIARDYMNVYTPYRGLLLYHGLGSGKTCSSIVIAEGLKSTRNVIIMTPASLKTNFREELKKCGDYMYKKNKHWEFISTEKKPSLVKLFEKELYLTSQFITAQKGVWLVNNEPGKEPNYMNLSQEDKNKLDHQIDKMIDAKYQFIAYNGIRWNTLKDMTHNYSVNPFDNKVIIIDEAHNFVSRIVNKIDKDTQMNAATKSEEISLLITKISDIQTEFMKKTKQRKEMITKIEEAKANINLIIQQNIDDSEKKLKLAEATKVKNALDESYKKILKECSDILRNKKAAKNNLGSLSCRLYEYLMTAKNAKIILLSGTPMINYPNEIGILFNILRGKITKWEFKLDVGKEIRKIDNAFFDSVLKTGAGNIHDYFEYSSKNNTLSITRNPFGFVSNPDETYKGVHISEEGVVDDDTFIEKLKSVLARKNISIIDTKQVQYKALPDKIKSFKHYFLPNDTFENENLLKRRIVGLTSYFRSAQEMLMPKYNEYENFHIIKTEMSNHQFEKYMEARSAEMIQEKKNMIKKKKGAIDEELTSTYRIFSRAFCNFVFPKGLERPYPNSSDDLNNAVARNFNEDMLDAVSEKEKLLNVDGIYEADDIDDDEEEQQLEDENEVKETKLVKNDYETRIKQALLKLIKNKNYLSKEGLLENSPKFLKMLENIEKNMDSLHLVYSQFRTLEGIGIFRYILEANGFARFKIKKDKNEWKLDMDKYRDKDGKLVLPPTYILYTGTESADEKEVLRNIFNGDWKYISQSIRDELMQIAPNNMHGEIIKVIMITASGAEGISLKNVRNVHITEPYWHPVRMEQVIGRARRICSHQGLPKELRSVDVYLYLMVFSEKQISEEMMTLDIRLADSRKQRKTVVNKDSAAAASVVVEEKKEEIEEDKKDKKKQQQIVDRNVLTSDEVLYEICLNKKIVTESILNAVKETAIDCTIHNNGSENLQCFKFISDSDNLSYDPDIENDKRSEMDLQKNIKEKEIRIRMFNIKDKKYYSDSEGNIYDANAYEMTKNLIKIGMIDEKTKQLKFYKK
jgi:hypothetical protein